MRKYFGTDGIRGIANDELTAELTFKIGKSTAYVLKAHNRSLDNVLIARDTRISGEMFEAALVSSMLSMGINVIVCGVMPTPVLAWLTHQEHTVGFMVSASHNPWMHNGIKIFFDGYKLPDELEEEIEDHLEDKMKSKEVGKRIESDLLSSYVEWMVSKYVDLKGLKIAFDLANGAAVTTVPVISKEIGIDAIFFNSDPDGININEGCGALHPQFLSSRIKSTGAEFGVIHDGDADRCIMIGKNGRIVDGDDMIVMNAKSMKKDRRLGANTVVGTVMTNLAIEEELRADGMKFARTKVGDRYVLEKMREIGSTLGGEQSGHIIFLDLSTTGDGFLTALETIKNSLSLGIDIEEFSSRINRYPQKLVNVPVKDKKMVMKNRKISEFAKEINSKEGLRIVIRSSGTESLIRIMVEGKSAETVEKVVSQACEIVEEVNASGEIS